GPLFKPRVLLSPVLTSAGSKAACYAVLPSLSERYPPLEGRSPTCYSPVCHSTHPLRGFRVRLACVRHAASVDSEPGSNSHVKFAACSFEQRNCLTRGRLALRCSIRVVICGRRQSPRSGLTISINRLRGAAR